MDDERIPWRRYSRCCRPPTD